MTNVCIVGLGSIAPIHISAINNCKTAKLYGICDIDMSKKQECEEKYGAKFFSDFDELMSKPIAIFEICLDKFGKRR
jgi:predicted dehydrogenase